MPRAQNNHPALLMSQIHHGAGIKAALLIHNKFNGRWMFMAIFDFDINLLYESVIYAWLYVFASVLMFRERPTRRRCHLCAYLRRDITGYVIINRFIAVPFGIYRPTECVNCALCDLTALVVSGSRSKPDTTPRRKANSNLGKIDKKRQHKVSHKKFIESFPFSWIG